MSSSRWTENREVNKEIQKLKLQQQEQNLVTYFSSSSERSDSGTSAEENRSESSDNDLYSGTSDRNLTDESLRMTTENLLLHQDICARGQLIEFESSASDRDNRSAVSAAHFDNSLHNNDTSSLYTTTTDSAAIYYNTSTDSSYSDEILNNFDDIANENPIEEAFNGLTITERIAQIKIKTNCSLTTIAEISNLLRDLGHNIPKDPRTIMKTKVCDLTKLNNGVQCNSNSFVHLGLIEGIRKKLMNADKKLMMLILQFNIDGLPLWRSSRTQFWPIVCRIINCQDSSEFLVTLHCGVGKPLSVRSYLRPFLDELKALLNDGLLHFGQKFDIRIGAFCCDAPARALIKQIIGHTGYCACERCETHGMRSDNRTTFPQLTAALRTDESFRAGSDEHHHNSISPLEEIDNLDMVFDIPLDYLHLVCFGAMKRLLKMIWLEQHPDCVSKQQQRLINELIRLCAMQLPKEFNRKGRSLEDISNWKATEFRTFLLYTGKLKRLLRNSRLPLKQIVRRLSEIDAMQSAMKRTGLNERCGKSKSYDTFATIIPQSKNDSYIIVPRARHPIVIKVTAMDSLYVTGYALRIEKRRDGNFEEFYSHPAKASELNVYKVRGLIRQKKWNKNEIKNAIKAVFLRNNVMRDYGLVIPLLHLSSQ
ncbi:uncharacterized protein LOC123466887 [Daphnia magna]|nr:uncharacterized protein LOC123466887 [Daphnia magna]